MDTTLNTTNEHRPDNFGQLADRYALLLGQHEMEVRLADRLGSGCEFPEMFAAIAESTDLPMWVFDTRGQRVLRSGDRELAPPDITSMCTEGRREQRGSQFMIAHTPNGVARRCLVERIDGASADEFLGWLVMGEIGRTFRQLDHFLMDRGAVYLARHCTLHQAMHRSIADLTRGFVERLLRRGEQGESTVEDARRLGIASDSSCIIVAIDDSALSRGVGDIDSLTFSLNKLLAGKVFGARTPRGPVLIVDHGAAERTEDSRLIEEVCRGLSSVLPDSGVQCGVSSAVGVDAITEGYDEALEVVACLERFIADHTRILSVRDLGPARILVANGNIAAIRRYVEHTLGPLWSEEADSDMEILMATLAQFSRMGHSVRRTAAAMSVHENTVRQRLARVRRLTGLDMLNDPFAQLSVHTALAIIALRNRAHPLWDPRRAH
ncbi:PucR family transcriptional regulator [Rhodococcus sp. USK13]|uniref:PucR family transcriptional regulator n=1 Tax=Rhodococcus sp. USK13 TaxID=2806442 RepID=UPI001BCE6684|nr:PucR family transcriptional regulator [Rhodococcus sp. USK13]